MGNEDFPAGATRVDWMREAPLGMSVAHAPASSLDPQRSLRGWGVAAGDLDGDGDVDLVAPTGDGPTLVLRNGGGLRFSDATAASGVDGQQSANGAALCDLDGDGDLDLLLSSDAARMMGQSNLRLYTNRGDATFTDATAGAGLTVRAGIRQVLCVDLDGDGLLDVYVVGNTLDLFTPQGREDHLYRNRGDGTFEDLTGRLPLDTRGYGWAAAAADLDGDGDLDLYVANDTFVPDDGTRPLPAPNPAQDTAFDQVLRNGGPGADGQVTLVDVAMAAGVVASRSSMGIVLEDFDGDGTADAFVSDLGRNELYKGGAGLVFSDVTATSGLELFHRDDPRCIGVTTPQCLLTSWGAVLADFDQDGARDLLVAHGQFLFGAPDAGRQPQGMFRGAAGGRFSPVQVGGLGWMDARALVPADLDGDGDLDVLFTTWNGPLRAFENLAPAGGLRVRLASASSAPEGRGAVVRLTAGARTETRFVGAGGVAYSSAPSEAHFALAGASSGMLEVRWPSGFLQTQAIPGPGIVTVREPPLVRLSARTAAAGTGRVDIVVTPYAADGATRLGAAAPVTIEASAGTFTGGGVFDAQAGSTTRTLSSASAALAVVRITIAGTPLRLLPRVEFR